MQLTSTSIPDRSVIDLRYAEPGVGGQNVSPHLRWTPDDHVASSYAITCFDPDAPTGSGWWHWVVTDIPADITELPEGVPLPSGARTWPNDFGYSGWGGPWPPPGPAHHYIFRVVAVAIPRLDVPDDATSAAARLALSFHELGDARITGTFQNPGLGG